MAEVPTQPDTALEESKADPRILEMEAQNDRGAAIVGSAILEGHLAKAIQDSWPPMSNTIKDRLFSAYGPLSSFSAKIDIASAMYLISNNTRLDVHTIKRIRNQAAHIGLPFSFDSDEIKPLVEELLVPKHMPNDEFPNTTKERNAFTTTVRAISVTIWFQLWMREKGGPKIIPFDFIEARPKP